MRQFFERTLQYSKNKLSNIKTKIISEYNSRDTYKDLAPIDNISNKNEYLKALHWAIKNKRIKNIALTGPYGSGKSSIINSYLKRHPLIKTRHLRISLATFIENTTDESEKPQKIKLDSKQIEEGILKQLFYKVNHHKIPQSRYRKLYRVKYLSAWLTIFFLFTFITLFLFVFKPEFFDNAVSLIIDAGVKLKLTQAHTCLSFCGIILLLISLITFIWRQLYSKVRISEIKVKETSIGTDKKEAESIFNKNMDEIIYFFEETKYRVVFFEDLDRLDSSKIFVQLRELNILLNNSDTIKHPIVFVYAVRDDIFTEKDRTKFFEFIIPVIPIINSTNSGEILLKLFSTKDCKSFKHDITFDYILDVSPYISDMRVLQNIHNEFLLYKRTLRTDQGLALDDKMMLSLIIFKNLYPKEFSDLQMESGIIKQAFKDKEQYIEKKRNILQEEIDASSDLIKKVNDDVLKSLQEIKVSLLCELTGWKGFTTEIGDSWRTDYTANQIMNPSFDLSKLLEFQSRYIRYDTWSGSSNSRINIPAFSELCAPYFERFERLNDYETKQLASIQKEIEDKKNLRSQLSSWSLKNTMAAVGDDAVLSSDVKSNKFLVFMLRKGYINEEYVNYINYFKGNSITIDDMNYILGIKDLEAKAFNYSLSKPEQVVQRLLPHEFKQKEALNFDILESLLSSTAYNDKLAAMMERLSDGTNLSWQFIDEFVNRTIYLPRFIQLLSQHWTQMWTCIYRNPILTYNRKIIYLSLLCMHTEIATLLDLNSEEKLITKFFEEHDDIFQKLSNVDPEKMVTIIPKLNIRFTKLNIKSVDNDILDCIFDNNFYQINPDMIQKIVTYKDPALCNKLQKQNYSTIMALGYSPLIEHIHANLPFYIDNIVLNGINRNENINQIISLLNLCITDVERCKKIIQFEVFRLSNISLCCGNQYTEHKEELEIIWNTLLEFSKVEPTWENIDRYWNYFGLTDSLLEYIVANADNLKDKSSSCLDNTLRKELIQSSMDSSVFEKLLNHLQLLHFDIPLKHILEANVEIMIKHHYLVFTPDRYLELTTCHPVLCTLFILENKEDFLSTSEIISLEKNVFEDLVLSEQEDRLFKEKIIKVYGANLMSKEIAESICTLNLFIDKNVFEASWNVLDRNQKGTLLFGHLDILKSDDFEKYFKELGKPYQDLADRSRRHNVTLPKSEEHKMLAKRLESIDYITSYDDSGYVMREYDHTSKKMIDSPAILYRIKATSNKSPI